MWNSYRSVQGNTCAGNAKNSKGQRFGRRNMDRIKIDNISGLAAHGVVTPQELNIGYRTIKQIIVHQAFVFLFRDALGDPSKYKLHELVSNS